jgi:ATP-dependent Clp protease ATP-binding subunit ClpC
MTAGKKSFRVYFVTHADGRMTGILMRNWSSFFDAPPPSAYGTSEEDVYRQLEVLLREAQATGKDTIERYLWEEEFETRRITVEIHPQAVLDKRLVIGKSQIPLRLTYAWSKLENGGYRVMLPRFEWWFILEDLDIAGEVLKNAVSAALLGSQPRWLYDFRHEGEEIVRSWTPSLLSRIGSGLALEGGDSDFPTLEAVAEELVDRAAKGKLPPVVGLDQALEPHLALFKRTPPASILLVGGTGVGKTSWVRRLARLFLSWKREKHGQRAPRIWATSRDRIVAGMIYLGMWQERCLKIMQELSGEGDYLFVDRLTSLLEPQPDGSSIAELFAPAILSEEISLIAECSESELERCRKRFPTLVNAFQLIRIPETRPSEMPPLLVQYQAKKGAKLAIHPQALKRIVDHLDSFQKDARFPGKAFRFLDWLNQDLGVDRATTVYPSDVSKMYSRFSGLPLELISDEHPATEEEIAARLRRRVVGQDAACRASANILARFKARISDPEKPCGSLFFVGPTGVGKTELAKQLARYMFGAEDRMIRLDMTEYMTPGSAQRLLDVGEGSKTLAERVRQQPLSLVLLDEIEKAHPEVFDLLLGILGEGRLTDALGRLVDFRMVLIVMTSNLGVREGSALGFDSSGGADYVQSVRRHFRPEFFNRIDEVITFRSLAPADITAIVDLVIDGLSERTGLLRRNLKLRVHAEAKHLLAELGYHPTRGARPLKRLVEERVITPVAVRMSRDPEFKDREIPVLLRDTAAWAALSDREKDDAVTLERTPAVG